MRSLQECQAEIFRRSEKKIRQRWLRQRIILAICLPLVALLVFWLSPSGSEKQSYESAGEILRVDGPEVTQIITDASEISRVKEYFRLCEPPDAGAFEAEKEHMKAPESSGTVYGSEARYTLLLTSGNGIAEYSLAGSILTNEATGDRYILSKAQLLELKELLNI